MNRPFRKIGILVLLLAVTSSCTSLFEAGLEPLPTVDLTSVSLLTPGPTATEPFPTELPTRTAVVTAGATEAASPTSSAQPTSVVTRTVPPTWTAQPTLNSTQVAAVPTTPPTRVPPAAPSALRTPPVNRNNDVTGPIDIAGTSYSLALMVPFISYPVALADPHDGSGRLFIASQEGRVFIYQNGAILPEPFLDIDPLVIERREEQGLLGLVFHPNYAQNGYFYVHYISPDVANIVERYTVSAGNPNKAEPASKMLMLRVPGIDGMHNGGQLAFGPFDGDLYIGMGDGGGANDPNDWSQNLSVLRGKILRLDVDGAAPYAIPPENPFAGGGAAREVWAYGFRNPWRFSFDRARGDLWIADVGQENNEEINFQEVFKGAGLNYGWDLMEGLSCNLGFPCEGRSDLVTPLQYYWHQEGRCAVIGGYVYRGPSMPGLTAAYLYGDFCTGEIWAMRFNAAGDAFFESRLMDSNLSISSFGEDDAGNIYVLSLSGEVYRLVQS